MQHTEPGKRGHVHFAENVFWDITGDWLVDGGGGQHGRPGVDGQVHLSLDGFGGQHAVPGANGHVQFQLICKS